MHVKKILAWVGVVTFAMLALVAFALGGIGSGMIFLLIAFICSPFRGLLLSLLPEKIRKKGVAVASAVVLSLAGFVGIPTDSMEPVEQVTEEMAAEPIQDIKPDENEELEVADKSIPQKEENTSDVEISDTSSIDSTTKIDNSNAQIETAAEVAEKSTSTTSNETVEVQDSSSNEVSTTTEADTVPVGGVSVDKSVAIAPQTGSYYVVNSSNGKVHTNSCGFLPDTENRIIFNTKEDVLNAGYSDPCGKCKPW